MVLPAIIRVINFHTIFDIVQRKSVDATSLCVGKRNGVEIIIRSMHIPV